MFRVILIWIIWVKYMGQVVVTWFQIACVNQMLGATWSFWGRRCRVWKRCKDTALKTVSAKNRNTLIKIYQQKSCFLPGISVKGSPKSIFSSSCKFNKNWIKIFLAFKKEITLKNSFLVALKALLKECKEHCFEKCLLY